MGVWYEVILGVQTVKDEDVSKYGIVNGDRVYTIKDLVEKPTIGEAPSNVAILQYLLKAFRKEVGILGGVAAGREY